MSSASKLHPFAGFVLIVALCHGGMWTLAYLVENRVLDWHKQYVAFVFGDVLLALAFATGLWANQRLGGLPNRAHWSQWSQTRALAFVAVVFLAVYRWGFNDYDAYTVGQSASPTKLYHDLLFVVVGYLILMVVLPLLDRSWLVLLPLLFVAGWVLLGVVFDAGQGWKTAYAHVDYDWWVKDFVQKFLDPYLRRG